MKSSLKDAPHVAATSWLAGLLGVNIFVSNALIAKTIYLPFLFINANQGGLFIILLFGLIVL